MGSGDGRVVPVVEAGLSPVLLWDESFGSADGAALACPQCAGANLHLHMVRFAAPVDDTYDPAVGVSINAVRAEVDGEVDEALRLHGGANRGPMLAMGYWCETGCQGRIEFREHKGHLFVSLHSEPGGLPDDIWLEQVDHADATVIADPVALAPF